MRPIDEIARTAFELLQHGDQGARLIGDVTVGELLAVVTYAFVAYEKAERAKSWEGYVRSDGDYHSLAGVSGFSDSQSWLHRDVGKRVRLTVAVLDGEDQ